MRVTTGPPKRVVRAVASAVAIALSLLVLVLVAAAVGSMGTSDDPDPVTPPADATGPDAAALNPWAAGDAAALQELADLGRAHLDGCTSR